MRVLLLSISRARVGLFVTCCFHEHIFSSGRCVVRVPGLSLLQFGSHTVLWCFSVSDSGSTIQSFVERGFASRKTSAFSATSSHVLFSQPAVAMMHRSPKIKPFFRRPLRDICVQENGEAMFVAELGGSPYPLITWFHNDDVITKSENYRYIKEGERHSLVVARATAADHGVIACRASNVVGESFSTARLLVQPPLLNDNATHASTLGDTTEVDSIEGSRQGAIRSVEIGDGENFTQNFSSYSGGNSIYVDETIEDPSTRSLSVKTDSEVFHELSADETSQNMSHNTQILAEAVTFQRRAVKKLESKKTRKKLQIRKRSSAASSSVAVLSDWVEEVRKLIREEIEKREVAKREEPQVGPAAPPEVSPPRFVKPITDCEVRAGETGHFVYILTSCPLADVVWLRNNSPLVLIDDTKSSECRTTEDESISVIADDDAGCLVISETDSHHSGVYTCVASNEHGSIRCSARLLVLGSKPLLSTRDVETFIDVINVPDVTSAPLIDRESQTSESRVSAEEDRRIVDAFKQMEDAEKSREVADVIIGKEPAREADVKADRKLRKKKKRRGLAEQSLGRMDDNETGEGLRHCFQHSDTASHALH